VRYVDPDGREPKHATLGNAINLDFGRDYMDLATANFREGEYGWAAVMVANATFEAAYDLLLAYGAASFIGSVASSISASTVTGTGATTATTNVSQSAQKGVSVIGPRATYREYAQRIGANFLNVTDQAWTKAQNRAYLQDIIKRGDDVIFAGKFDPAKLDPKSTLAWEIKTLIKAGYKWTEDFSKLIKE